MKRGGLDAVTLVGLILAVVSIIAAVVLDGNAFAPLLSSSAFAVVIVGTVGVTLVGTGLTDLKRIPGALKVLISTEASEPDARINDFARLSDLGRKQGVLALEREIPELEDSFLAEGVQMIADGHEGEQIKQVLEAEIDAVQDRHQVLISVFRRAGAYAPTIGMMGTVIGLVNMLGDLSDPDQIGAGMALALLTTLYGVMLANLVVMPIADKLERANDAEIAAREMMLDGILAMQAGASPRNLVERLESYLPPAQRVGLKERQEQLKDAGVGA